VTRVGTGGEDWRGTGGEDWRVTGGETGVGLYELVWTVVKTGVRLGRGVRVSTPMNSKERGPRQLAASSWRKAFIIEIIYIFIITVFKLIYVLSGVLLIVDFCE
jgi:hypothetical protein